MAYFSGLHTVCVSTARTRPLTEHKRVHEKACKGQRGVRFHHQVSCQRLGVEILCQKTLATTHWRRLPRSLPCSNTMYSLSRFSSPKRRCGL
uniref:Uncharacterized protein n=1 Tax=Lepeophtheirus salmonis TaxID=72036 RepID=A0A0K2TT32_LEPSM